MTKAGCDSGPLYVVFLTQSKKSALTKKHWYYEGLQLDNHQAHTVRHLDREEKEWCLYKYGQPRKRCRHIKNLDP